MEDSPDLCGWKNYGEGGFLCGLRDLPVQILYLAVILGDLPQENASIYNHGWNGYETTSPVDPVAPIHAPARIKNPATLL
jgi:hypothetical protein